MNLQAKAHPAATRKLGRQNSALKEKYADMRAQLSELTNTLKDKTSRVKTGASAQRPVDCEGPADNKLEHGNSWKAAAAVKALKLKRGLTRKSKGARLFLTGLLIVLLFVHVRSL